ncbi:putative glycosyl [Golovinomyces cichoracearum]|uniref:Putative glycosyl n=1 Tax=Golovinomyces cichoracearum TaxID=62708 RepID=A0A420IUM4_9PEZI|nr:putative glycosyl [Golovinomyces cichoracearum]
MLTGTTRNYYFDNLVDKNLSFEELVRLTRQHSEADERHQEMFSLWHTISHAKMIRNNTEKSIIDCFEILINRLCTLQHGLSEDYKSPNVLRDRIINSCRDVKECTAAILRPASSVEAVCAELRNSIDTFTRITEN